MKRISILIAIIFLLSPLCSYALDKLPGKYELIGDINDAFGKDRVTMTEFFNFSCGHCYKFLSTAKRLQEKFGDKLVHEKVPVFWGKQTPFPAIAYYIAKEKGMAKSVTQSIFDANFLGGAQIFDARVLNFIISDAGMPVDISKQSQFHNKVRDGMTLASKYGANETPTVVLNGVIKVSPRISEGNIEAMTKNLDQIISKLLSK